MDQEELRRALQSKAGIRCSDGAMLAQLCGAAGGQGLSAKDVASKLSAWVINEVGVVNGGLSPPLVDRFVAKLQRDCNKENQAAAVAAAAARTPAAAGTPAGRWFGGSRDPQGGAATPPGKAGIAGSAGAKGSPQQGTPQSAPRTAFKARTNRGQVVCSLNADKAAGAADQEARVVHVTPRGVQLPSRHTYLLERLEDKVAATNARIAAWKQWVAAAVGGSDGGGEAQLEWAPVGAPAQEDSFFAGRVVCEVEGAALNDTCAMLEGDSETSGGARVPLDLSQLPAFRLFPGQVVAVRGVNPSGAAIVVRQLWSHLPPPAAAAAAHRQQQQQQLGQAGAGAGQAAAAGDAMDVDAGASAEGLEGLGSSGGVTAVVAAGPFCLADDTGYEPLQELLVQLRERPPNMLVLLGPFVDVEQPLIAGGMLDVTFQQLFQTQVADRLAAWQASLPVPCQVVLMPAVRDAFHHPTFPQPGINVPGHDQHLMSLQNPCSFTAGPMTVAAQTTDVLRHLSAVELARNAPGAPPDRLAGLASHIIGQRRFYPLYPAPPGTCLDLTGDPALHLQQLPDLLLLPSDLAPFAKFLAAPPATSAGGSYTPLPTNPDASGASGCQQVCVVNPGRLAKGGSGGTYACVMVAEGSGPFAQRCSVDIKRV